MDRKSDKSPKIKSRSRALEFDDYADEFAYEEFDAFENNAWQSVKEKKKLREAIEREAEIQQRRRAEQIECERLEEEARLVETKNYGGW